MPRKAKPIRPLEKIFEQADAIGTDNVMLNDGELGLVFSGEEGVISPFTIANWRSCGKLKLPRFKAGRDSRYKLSDAIRYRDSHMKT